MNFQQIMSLVINPMMPGRQLAWQLREEAAWLAAMNPQVFREIMTINPEVLLQSDTAIHDQQLKEQLVEALFEFYDD